MYKTRNTKETDLNNQMFCVSFVHQSYLHTGSGSIEFPEFLTMMTKRLHIDPDDEMKEAFRVFDRDGDGYVVVFFVCLFFLFFFCFVLFFVFFYKCINSINCLFEMSMYYY